jgi:hypothetical protein
VRERTDTDGGFGCCLFVSTRTQGAFVRLSRPFLILTVGAAAALVPAAIANAGAASHASLAPVPHNAEASGDSHTTAHATLVREGNFVIASVHVDGAAPGLVHAQHIHGMGAHACPGIDRDTDHDGLINTSEGAPDYGPVVVSLTESGDTSPSSALAVDRFPVANDHGSYTYVRKLRVGVDVSNRIADNLDQFHIVVHGIDTNHNGGYDFSKGPSDLNPAVPQEATVPAACGLIH